MYHLRTLVLTILPALLAPAAAGAASRAYPPSPVAMQVTVAFNAFVPSNQAWLPVRVSLDNRSSAPISGAVESRDSTIANPNGVPQPFDAVYATPVVLPAGSTKVVTLYLPGSDVQSEVDVAFRQGARTLATASAYPSDLQYSDVTVGALTNDLSSVAWLGRVSIPRATLRIVPLTPSTLDPVPPALASFDVIVVSNADTSRLDRNQVAALERYVHNGGALIVIGGADWQETLTSLPSALLPGSVTSSRTVSNLSGLSVLGNGRPPAAATTVSILSRPRGAVLVAQRSTSGIGPVPLVVRSALGNGQVEYLAFDPGLDPIARWAGAQSLLTHLLGGPAPRVLARLSLPALTRSRSSLNPGSGPLDIASELANIPAAALPSYLLVIILTAAYIVLIGPVNFIILQHLKRSELGWITVPVLALLGIGSTFGVAYRLKGNTVLLNTVGAVLMDGSGDRYPASLYVGLFAPLRGDYRLSYGGLALPAPILSQDFGGVGSIVTPPVGWRFQEGPRTAVDFPAMNMWSMRAVSLHTTVAISGAIQSALQLDRSGDIVGSIRNDTSLLLLHPAIIAGRSVESLSNLSPGATVQVHVRPANDIRTPGHPQMLFRIYGQACGVAGAGSPCGATSSRAVFQSSGGAAQPAEDTLAERIRNAASMLPESNLISTLGEVTLVGWTEQSLGSLTVEGAAPQRRDITLIARPLSVRLPAGPFRLRTGTLGAHIVEEEPARPQNSCCDSSLQQVHLGIGGSATFEFDVPPAATGTPAAAVFRRLTLWARTSDQDFSTTTSGAAGNMTGSVFDWRRQQWIGIAFRAGQTNLPDPGRFLSPTGALLFRLEATKRSGEIVIVDPLEDLQLSGTGVAP